MYHVSIKYYTQMQNPRRLQALQPENQSLLIITVVTVGRTLGYHRW